MGWRTQTFTTDNIGNPEQVKTFTVCKRVRIRERPPGGTIPYIGGTSGYQIFGVTVNSSGQPVPDGVSMTRFAGEESVFERVPWFQPNEVIEIGRAHV